MNNGGLSTDDLLRLTGYDPDEVGWMNRKLIAQGIKLFDGKNGPWTTIDLINAAGGLTPKAENEDNFYPDDIIG